MARFLSCIAYLITNLIAPPRMAARKSAHDHLTWQLVGGQI